MAKTVKELIKYLNATYQPDEVLASTFYSKADVEYELKERNREDIDADEVWREIADDLESGMGDSQEGVSIYLSELVNEQVALYEDPEDD
jgi:hypothetical protein